MQRVKLAQVSYIADDTNMLCSNENVEVLQDTLIKLAQRFVWFSINKLSLNSEKQTIYCFKADHPTLRYI